VSESDEDQEVPPAGSGGVRGWRALGGIAAMALALRRMNQAARRADPEDPGFVAVSDRAVEVAEHASDLAESGREDDQAVAELVALAQGSKRTLENAERFSRQGARHCEDENDNRANRLLVAAVNGKSVQPASLEAKQLFEIVEGFHALPQASAWESLVSREPRLAELESETRRGAFTRAVPVIRKTDPVLQHMARQRVLAGSELGDRLRELVGPRAAATDPLITSRAAFESALAYLASVDEAASQ
jgi:hypothetical protein